jgi:alpha-glucosidase
VAPVVTERLDPHLVELPPGTWFGLRDGKRHTGTVTFDPAPREVPVFVHAGAIVPMQPLVQNTGETPQGPLEVHVWVPDAGGDCSGTLYDDDGHSMAFERGAFLRIRFACEAGKDGTTVTARSEHAGFAPWWKSVDVIVHGADGATRTQRVEGPQVDWSVRVR